MILDQPGLIAAGQPSFPMREKPELSIAMPVICSVMLNPEVCPWLSTGDANLIQDLLLHSPGPFAQD